MRIAAVPAGYPNGMTTQQEPLQQQEPVRRRGVMALAVLVALTVMFTAVLVATGDRSAPEPSGALESDPSHVAALDHRST
jgi:hypothetical protein